MTRVVLAGLLALSVLGCARRTDEATRRAWEKAGGNQDDPSGGATGGQADGDTDAAGQGSGRAPAFGWDRVEQLLDEGLDVMQRAPDPEALAELAAQWCDVEPEARDSPDGPVYVCFPTPPVRVDEARFSLEMGGAGVIGLVVRDVSAQQAVQIEAKARQLATKLCRGEWKDAGARSDAQGGSQFTTCSAGGGPLVAVGRFALDAAADRWQVSVAIVSAS